MGRLRKVLWLVIVFELGVILVVLPWLRVWDSNPVLSHYPALRPYLLHPSARGAITGLGALDILLAVDMVWRRLKPAQTRRV